jgi:hypothetical protein
MTNQLDDWRSLRSSVIQRASIGVVMEIERKGDGELRKDKWCEVKKVKRRGVSLRDYFSDISLDAEYF